MSSRCECIGWGEGGERRSRDSYPRRHCDGSKDGRQEQRAGE